MTTTATRARRGPTLGRRAVLAAVAGLVVLVVVAAAVVGRLAGGGAASAPYTDPVSTGPLTLCVDGKPVTSGSTAAFPFVSAVVGGKAGAAGSTAALFAYQPRAGVGPEEWSGLQLTGALRYADPATPGVTLTSTDTTLGQFLGGYPAVDDGWVQLRLYLGAPGAPTATAYATADLHVDGSTWKQVGGGHASCPSSAPSN